MSEEELHAGVAEGRFERTDLVHLEGQEEWQPLERLLGAQEVEAMTDFEANVHIGDEVMVLGNSGGGGVVTRLRGKIQGIGPRRAVTTLSSATS